MTDFSGKSFKAQMRAADRNRCRFVIILGENELSEKKIVLKNMDTSEQKEYPMANLIEIAKFYTQKSTRTSNDLSKPGQLWVNFLRRRPFRPNVVRAHPVGRRTKMCRRSSAARAGVLSHDPASRSELTRWPQALGNVATRGSKSQDRAPAVTRMGRRPRR